MRSLTEVIREASIDLSARASNGSLDKIAGALTLKRGEQLASSEKALVFEMYKQNMGHVFQSIGEEFVDAEKESYLFAPNSFFVFAGSSSQLTGFALFRLEPDDLDEPEYPVVFLYELQVAAPHQGSGLGRQLFQAVRELTRPYGLTSMMLTCYKCNAGAMRFYTRNGFAIDENSPSKCGHMRENYELLSMKF